MLRVTSGLLTVLVVAVFVCPLAAENTDDAAAKKLLAANSRFQAGMYELAAKHYAEFLQKYRSHEERPAAHYGLAICKLHLKDYGQAESHAAEALKHKDFAQRAEAYILIGQARMAQNNPKGAMDAFAALLKNHPKSSYADLAHLNIIQALIRSDQHAEALKHCQTFLKERKDSGYTAAVLYFQGMCQRSLGQHAHAAKSLLTVADKHPNAPFTLNALLLAGQSLESAGHPDQAVAPYRKMLELAPPNRKADARYSLAMAYRSAGQHAKAIDACQDLLKHHADSPYAPIARLEMGISQLQSDKVSDARKTLAHVVKHHKQQSADAHYWLARCDMAERKWKDARDRLEPLLKNPKQLSRPDAAAFDRAVCTLELGDPAQAAQQFQAFGKDYSKSDYADNATYQQAFALHQAGQHKQALQVAAPLAKQSKHPLQKPAAEIQAECLFLLGQYDQARKAYAELAKSAKGPDADRIQLRRGEAAYRLGQHDDAAKLLAKLASQRNADKNAIGRQAMYLLGRLEQARENASEAIQWFTRYLKTDGQDHRIAARYYLGAVLRQADRADDAAKQLTEVAKLNPDASPLVPFAWYELADLHYQADRPDDAAGLLDKLLTVKNIPAKLHGSAIYLRASIHFDRSDYAKAAQTYAQLLKEHPDHPDSADAAFQTAESLRLAGEHDKAIARFQAFLKDHPKDPRRGEARRLIGICLDAAGKHDQAVRILAGLAKDKQARSPEALYSLAWAHKNAGQRDQAIAPYTQLIEQFGDSPQAIAARTELGELLYAREKYDEAAKLLAEALASKDISPQARATALYRLAWCHHRLDNPKQALQAFTQFAGKYADHENTPSALYQAALAAQSLRQFSEAEKLLVQLIRTKDVGDLKPFALIKLAESREKLGQFKEALQTYEAYLKEFGKEKFAYLAQYGTGWCLQNLRKYDDARKWYAKLAESDLKVETAAKAQFQIGECFLEENKLPEALAAFYAVSDVYNYPKWTANALYEAGRVLEKMDRTDQAIAEYKRVAEKFKDQKIAAAAKKRLAELDAD